MTNTLEVLFFAKSFEELIREECSNEEEEEEEEENNLIKTLFMSLINTCYLEPCEYNVSKSQKWWYNVLNTYNDNRFKI